MGEIPTARQLEWMRVIRARAPVGIRSLARALRVSPAGALHVVRVLARKRFVRRDPDGKLRLTAAGKKWIEMDFP